MPLQVLTSENLEKMSKETGHSINTLRNLLNQAAVNGKPAYVQAPLPKHLR